MKSTALWALVIVNVLLLGMLLGRGVRPNAAVAQMAGGRPGDYTVLPVEFPGATVGTIVLLDNTSGEMTAIQTDESTKRMTPLPKVNVADLFSRAGSGGGRPVRR